MAELTWGGVDLRRADGTVWSWILAGWIDDPPEVIGQDEVLPGSGLWPGDRIPARRQVVMHTVLEASSASGLLALQLELAPVWDPTADPMPIVVADGYRGLPAGVVATLLARCARVAPAARRTETRVEYEVTAECVDSPPRWALTGQTSYLVTPAGDPLVTPAGDRLYVEI